MPDQYNEQSARARAVYLQVLLACGGSLGSRTGMWKAFWAAHLIHLRNHGTELTRWPILKWKHGPGPKNPYDIEAALEVRGLLEVTEEFSAGYKFVTLRISDRAAAESVVAEALTATERASVVDAVEWQNQMYAKQLSEFTHQNSVAWRRAEPKGEMDIYVDLLKENPLGRLTTQDKKRLEEERVHRRAAEQYLADLFAQ